MRGCKSLYFAQLTLNSSYEATREQLYVGIHISAMNLGIILALFTVLLLVEVCCHVFSTL